MTRVSIGISTCPNDTFAFHALLEGVVEIEGVTLEFLLADIEELNEAMHAGRLDVAKVSTHAALARADELAVLPVGWALGYGVGPVVLSKDDGLTPASFDDRARHVLCPGRWTTATLLMRLFHGSATTEHRLEQRVFSEIVPALQRGTADCGVCIHEGRFTYEEQGLALVEDLGETWEKATGCALPLGGPVARRDLDPELVNRIVRGIRASLTWGEEQRQATLPTMRRHAQEHSDEVLWNHVELYVNDWTRELGETGRQAFGALSRLARERELVAPGADLTVWEPA